ncbi:MAG: UvrB/UvrC motif-containing protein [Synergistaceae bacterium]|jgi:protein arginine kinase activator|nr:UvrB/UvrC motif-containing protein [Synergistaceae bacterium]
MLCDNCGKKDVEILIKQVVNQDVHILRLCRACAEELGFVSPDIPSVTIVFSGMSSDFQKTKKVKRVQPKKKEQFFDSLVCSSCGIKFGEFREIGLLGCPKCYEAFRAPLGAYLQRTQGAESHWGVTSAELFEQLSQEAPPEETADVDASKRECLNDERERNMIELQIEMSEAVSQENYERAAELRDIMACLRGEGRINGS